MQATILRLSSTLEVASRQRWTAQLPNLDWAESSVIGIALVPRTCVPSFRNLWRRLRRRSSRVLQHQRPSASAAERSMLVGQTT